MKSIKILMLLIFCSTSTLSLSQQNITRHPFIWNLGATKTDSTVLVYTQVFDTLFTGNNLIQIGTVTQEFDLYGNPIKTSETWPFSDNGSQIVRDTMLIGFSKYIPVGDTIVEFGFVQYNDQGPSANPKIPLYILLYNQQGDTIATKYLPTSNEIYYEALRMPILYNHALKLTDTTFMVSGFTGNNSQNLFSLYLAKIHLDGTVLKENLITSNENPIISLPNTSLFYSNFKNEIHVYYNNTSKLIVDAKSLELTSEITDNFAGFTFNFEEINHPLYKYINATSWDGKNPVSKEQIYDTDNNSDVFLFLMDDSLNVDTVQIKLPDAEAMFLGTECIDYVDSNNIYLAVSHHLGFHFQRRFPNQEMNVGFSVVKCNIKGEVLWSKKLYESYEDLPNGGYENISNAGWKVFGLEDGGMIALITRYFHERPELQMDVMFIRTDANGNVVSVKTIDPKMEINVFPNPTNEELHISLNQPGTFNYVISGLSGKTIDTGRYINNESINLRNIPPGMYILTLQSETNKTIMYSTFQKK